MPDRRLPLLALVLVLVHGAGCGLLLPAPAWRSPASPAYGSAGSTEKPPAAGSSLETPVGPDQIPAPVREDLPGHGRRLLEHASLILDALDARSYSVAARETRQLTRAFPESESALLLQTLFERRLAQLGPGEAVAANAAVTVTRLHENAAALIKERRHEEARLLLERAHALDRKHSEVSESLVSLLKLMGLELYSGGNSIEAEAFWRRALEIRPDDPETRRYIQRAEEVQKKM